MTNNAKGAASPRTRPRAGAHARAAVMGQQDLPLVVRSIDRSGLIAIDRVLRLLGVSKLQLAQTAGLKPETLYKKTRLRADKTQSRMREMLEIVGRVSLWAGGENQALAWYRAQPIAAFGGRTAEALVKSGQASRLRDYLDHIAMGGFA